MMKKILSICSLLLILSLSGCAAMKSSIFATDNIETLKSWSFQYNEGTNDYSVFFGLLNGNDKYIAADVDIDIRIEDETGNEVYKATTSVTRDDFGYYSSEVAGEQYLANVKIPASEINAGNSSSGKVYLTIHKADVILFDEVNCDALFCLPVKDIQLDADSLPVELRVKSFNGTTASVIRIEDVSYSFNSSVTPLLNIVISGTKISGSNTHGYDRIGYKLFDSAGYVVDSGDVYLQPLSQGDKFKDDSILIYNITPAETYTIKFVESEW